MKRTSSRAEPISIHLERHRDCLERCHAERALAQNTSGRNGELGQSAFDLPFQRQDDVD
jgi:hypothetical protein